jgi:hypothetical protein
MNTSTEYAENVCRGLNLPIRGVAFIYIENAISAALDLQAEKFNARIAVLEQLNRDLAAALVNDDVATVQP